MGLAGFCPPLHQRQFMRRAGQSRVELAGTSRRTAWALNAAGILSLAACFNSGAADAQSAVTDKPGSELVPGAVIDYSPAATRSYIGSPSLAVLPNGDYVVSHDFFGPGTSNDTTAIFRSTDRGNSWKKVADVQGQWWSTLFVHRAALYLLGTSREYGDVVIRRSNNGGETWTTPTNSATGRLRVDGQYHCAPTPILEHSGRLWRGFERREPPVGWGVNFRAGMISAPVDADLLDSAKWTFSNFLSGNTNWLNGGFGGWLEGNAVATRDGQILDILRVDTPGLPEKAAIANISADGRLAHFDTQRGFIDFPGGAKKFTIRYDAKRDCYWSLATVAVLPRPNSGSRRRPATLRNILAMTSSSDLAHWTVRRIVLSHSDSSTHGFQYVDWLFDGEDLIAVCRSAFDDTRGGAHNYHDANFLTFHRFTGFRASAQTSYAPLDQTQAEPGKH
jgi:hypothetical protein